MKSLVCTVLVSLALAFPGNAAMAAGAATHKTASAQTVHARVAVTHRATTRRSVASARSRARVAGTRRVARVAVGGRNALGIDIGRFIQAMLGGGPVPYMQLVRDVARARGARYVGGTYDSSSSFSATAPDTPVDNSAEEAAEQASEEASQIDLQNSMEAAQEQNDEADAETNAGIATAEQTEINANQ
jgi:hypothetical protein